MQKTIGIIGSGRFATILKTLLERRRDVVVMQSSTSLPVDDQKIFDLQAVLNCDIVVVAIPISALESFLEKNSNLITTTPLFVDVCSVKVFPSAWMKKHLPHSVDILATHPLFGPTSTKQGTDFANLKCIFCPVRIHDKKRFDFFSSLFTAQDIVLHTMTPEAHDQMMARTQAMSFLFGHLGHELGLHPTDFDTAGFRSLLSNQAIVESDSHELLVDIFRFNPFARVALHDLFNHVVDFSCETEDSFYFYHSHGRG